MAENTYAAIADQARTVALTDWATSLRALNATLRATLDLQPPSYYETARPIAAQCFSTYLALCLDLNHPQFLPEAIAAIQGRKLAALMLEELDRAGAPPDSLRSQFQAVRLRLRQLALGLQVIEGGKVSALQSEGEERRAEVIWQEWQRRR